jgi:hypothetical protein
MMIERWIRAAVAVLAGLGGEARAQVSVLHTKKELHLYTHADKQFVTVDEPVTLTVWADTDPPKGSFVTSTSWINNKTYQGEIGAFLYASIWFRALWDGPPGKWSYLYVHPKMTYEWPELYPDHIKLLMSQMKFYPYDLDENLPIYLFTVSWRPTEVLGRGTVRFVPDPHGFANPKTTNSKILLFNANTGSGLFSASDFVVIEHPIDIIVLPEACTADCDASGTLTIDDFICFQTSFSMGDPAADCDGDGQLLIDDFICFQTAFAIGC